MQQPAEAYLDPYLRATQRHGAGFRSLLWASPHTQAQRFDAITRIHDFHSARILDAGCGRADLLDYWFSQGIFPAQYIGLEAVADLAHAARAKDQPGARILTADFVRHPDHLAADVDTIIFCGSLNTLDPGTFYSTLRTAYDNATHAVVFNFLCSPMLAAADWLHWHSRQDVLAFANRLSDDVRLIADYINGDCTIAMLKPGAE